MCTEYRDLKSNCSISNDAHVKSTWSPVGQELQKYGEILLPTDGHEFILCCSLCVEIFFVYEHFIRHVQELHNVSLQERDAAAKYKWNDELFDSSTSKVDGVATELTSGKVENYVELMDGENHVEDFDSNVNDSKLQLSSVSDSRAARVDYLMDECTYVRAAEDFEQQNISSVETASLIRNKRLLRYLIDLYKEHPCLWRADHEDIADRNKRWEALEQISAAMHQRFRFQITAGKILKTIRNILHEYHRIARAANSMCNPKLWYYRKLSFIENAKNYKEQGDEQLEKVTKPNLKCPSCKREFNTRHGLAQHQRTYTPCKPFCCTQCSKTFSSQANLQAHMVSHDHYSERRFTCHFCGLKIALQHNYFVHLQRHTKFFSHHCPTCGKGAASKTELKQHMLNHTGERPHCCEICGLTYRSRSALTRHRMQHNRNLNLATEGYKV